VSAPRRNKAKGMAGWDAGTWSATVGGMKKTWAATFMT
jgi:hypothetical protein